MFNLRNYSRLTDNASYWPNGFTDLYDATGNPTTMRMERSRQLNQGSVPINRVKGSRYYNQTIKIRNVIEDFVNSEEGMLVGKKEI